MLSRKIVLTSFILFVFSVSSLLGFGKRNGLEFILTFSGKILIGINYRYYIDNNTMLRAGTYMGSTGSPVGMHVCLVQDFAPAKKWAPYFGLGFDALSTKVNGKRSVLPFIRSVAGVSYQPRINLAQQSELWIAFFPQKLQIRPVGINIVHFNSIW